MYKIAGIRDITFALGYALCHSFLSLNIDKPTKMALQCNNIIVDSLFQEISLTGLLNNSTWGSAETKKGKWNKH